MNRLHTNRRISRAEMFMQMAEIAASRSTCSRKEVGCVITNHDGTTIVSIGYNGNARGLPNECDTDTPGDCGCIHAEVNALLKAPYQIDSHLVLYTTTSPCPDCAKLILNSKVHTVYFRDVYRVTTGILLLEQMGLKVRQIPSTEYEP